MRDEEKNFVGYCITPLMKGTKNFKDKLHGYKSREASLKPINAIWKKNDLYIVQPKFIKLIRS